MAIHMRRISYLVRVDNVDLMHERIEHITNLH